MISPFIIWDQLPRWFPRPSYRSGRIVVDIRLSELMPRWRRPFAHMSHQVVIVRRWLSWVLRSVVIVNYIFANIIIVCYHWNVAAKVASLQTYWVHLVRDVALIQIIIQIRSLVLVSSVHFVVTPFQNVLVKLVLVERHWEIIGIVQNIILLILVHVQFIRVFHLFFRIITSPFFDYLGLRVSHRHTIAGLVVKLNLPLVWRFLSKKVCSRVLHVGAELLKRCFGHYFPMCWNVTV